MGRTGVQGPDGGVSLRLEVRRGGEHPFLSGWPPVVFISCSEFYEPEALMMEEEGTVIVGLLVGLNVLDANLCLKGEDLDSQVGRESWL